MLNSGNRRMLIIWDRAGHYHLARWEALQKKMGLENVQLANLGNSDGLYQWGNEKINVYQLSEKAVNQFDLWIRLKRFFNLIDRFEVIAIAGYGRLEYILFLIISKIKKKKVILFAESWYPGNSLFDLLKGKMLNLLADRFFVSGKRAKDHFIENLKVLSKKISKGYSVVDNHHFAKGKLDINPLSYSPYILCVARYSQEKNLITLIKAYRKSKRFKQWKLVLIGDGPQYGELKEIIDGDGEWIVLAGWKSYEELPAWYQQANLFVLPSTFEPWGLVVNEAMAAGCPVIASSACGCVDDLFVNGKQFIFDPYNENELITLLEREPDGVVDINKLPDCQDWANNMVNLSGL